MKQGFARFVAVLAADILLSGVSQDFHPLPWDDAYRKARVTVEQMTQEEKFALMRGVGWHNLTLNMWWFVGNIPALPRLGVPSLNMQDSSSGFRSKWEPMVGTATCWPSMLAMAATWDRELLLQYGKAIGREFVAKGANFMLGPAVNVHRVAKGGRNFEYVSGEDPYLGSQLVSEFVKGVQSQGVMTVVKHYALNQQETNRRQASSVVDTKTKFELYYPPFQAAIDSGVGAVMCSYNKIDNVNACANSQLLERDLRQKMGFRGFVQSDWGATTHTAVREGLDMSMPLVTDENDHYAPEKLATIHPAFIDRSAIRILAAQYRTRVAKPGCKPPNCKHWLLRSVRHPAHDLLAREAASKSVVLLKNDGVLPVVATSRLKIAVVGSPAVATSGPDNPRFIPDYYSGGGSGHIQIANILTPLEGIRRQAADAGYELIASPTDNVADGLAAARQADVTLIIAATTSAEGKDRDNLHLDNNADELISAVSKVAKKTLVLAQIPGTVLMPWKDEVDGIAVLFLAGEATAHAWADLVFGKYVPTGRLPLEIPSSMTETLEPSPVEILYSEGLQTSYRNLTHKPAFPFGHGLTYTTFAFKNAESYVIDSRAFVKVRVENTGIVAASTVVQLYIEYSHEAGQPAPILKGFQRTPVLDPAAFSNVIFELNERDLSYYTSDDWKRVSSAKAHVGVSSRDILQTVAVAMPKTAEELFDDAADVAVVLFA